MENTPLMSAVMNHIVAQTLRGAGVRTTEVELVAEKLDADKQQVSNAIGALIESGEVKCLTEKFRQLDDGSWKGDYCWLVPGTYEDKPRPGYHHVEKVECKPFGIWPEPEKN